MTDIDPYGLDEPARPVPELVELFKRERVTPAQPSPETKSDTIRELAAQIRHALENRGTTPIDEITIVRNFADTISEIAVVVEGIVGDDIERRADWLSIREHLAGSVAGLGWIANGWI